ncbi:MAG: NAD-dependent epimerase/dehydratase family protein [Bacteroidota bacterium]
MRVIVIGGTGHIGTYLIPRLISSGHEVINISRKKRVPYSLHPAWESVSQITIDREQAEAEGNFGALLQELAGDVVIDLICFTPESAKMIAEALIGKVQQFIHCGTMWVHGQSEQVPTTEDQRRKPFGNYGINKAKIESYLLNLHNENGFPVTILHPGHISGPGWLPINPAGHLTPAVFTRLAKGKEIVLPNLGMETLHHVHADDVAQAFMKAIENRENAVGESFHVVSEQALTLRGYAEAMAHWFGKEANLSFLPWDEWKKTVDQHSAELTWDHIAHSPNGSIEKAKTLLGYKPQYSSLQTVQEAVKHYFEKENIKIN